MFYNRTFWSTEDRLEAVTTLKTLTLWEDYRIPSGIMEVARFSRYLCSRSRRVRDRCDLAKLDKIEESSELGELVGALGGEGGVWQAQCGVNTIKK